MRIQRSDPTTQTSPRTLEYKHKVDYRDDQSRSDIWLLLALAIMISWSLKLTQFEVGKNVLNAMCYNNLMGSKQRIKMKSTA